MKRVLKKHFTTIIIVALLLVAVGLLVMIGMAPFQKAQAIEGTPVTTEESLD